MKKTKQFNKGDKVFAKLKGYPPWPALIVGNNGKKYNVKFYGTGEIGLIKSEDLFYYLRHKKQFVKPLKRKDYNDALEEIEKAVKKDGDGDVDDSAIEDNSNTSLDSSTIGERKKSIVERKSSIGEMKSPVADKRTPKRKRTVGDKSETSQSPKKKSGRLRSSIGTIEVYSTIAALKEMKDVVKMGMHKIICSTKCQERKTDEEKIKNEMENEISKLKSEIIGKDAYIKRLKRETQDYEGYTIEFEEKLVTKIASQDKRLGMLNEEMDELRKRNAEMNENIDSKESHITQLTSDLQESDK